MPEENALVPYYGSTFPLLPQDELFRDSAVSTVLGLLESNFDVVFVEGQTGQNRAPFADFSTHQAELFWHLHKESKPVVL